MPQFGTEDYWKALILYGLNQATYKIALGKTLLVLCQEGYTKVPWDVLSKEFLQQYNSRLSVIDPMPQQRNRGRQTRMEQIIRACQTGKLSLEDAIGEVGATAFGDVIYRFHNLGKDDSFQGIFYKFNFGKEILLTDELHTIAETKRTELEIELDARWSLLEGAFTIGQDNYILANNLRLVLMVLILLSGCALTKEHINLDYSPQQNIDHIRGSENVGLKVNVTDARKMRDKVSYKKNAYGMEMAEIISNNDVVDLVTQSIKTELSSRGFNINGNDASLNIELVKFYNDFKVWFWSGEASAEVVMGTTVEGRNKTVYYNKIITGSYILPNIQIASGNNAKLALEGALSDAISKLVNDPKFIIALMEINK